MIVYRIAKTKYIHDMSGTGSKLYGGRWNRKGVALVYTSESRALATVEYLVHVPLTLIPNDLSIASVQIPDNIIPDEITPSDLPTNWKDYPAPAELADVGTQWVLAGTNLLLRVPSAIIEQEWNILINPLHTDMKHVTIEHAESYSLDKRLLR